MDKGSPAPAPDYLAAAQQQGQNNIDVAKMQNPNVIGPYGQQTVTYGGTPDQTLANFDSEAFLKAHPDVAAEVARGGAPYYNASGQYIEPVTSAWDYWSRYGQQSGDEFTAKASATGNIPTITQTLSPEQQKLLDQQNTIKGLLGGLGIQGAESLKGIVGTPMDFSGAPGLTGTPDLRNKMINAYMARFNEDMGNKREDTNSNLVASGFRPGTKGYDDRMNQLSRQENDAFSQAWLNSGQEMSREQQLAMQNRNQWLNEYQTKRQAPINEISALMSGSQVTSPFASPGVGGVNAQPTPYLSAMQAGSDYGTDLYNAQAAQAGGINQGLFGLGSTALLAGGILM